MNSIFNFQLHLDSSFGQFPGKQIAASGRWLRIFPVVMGLSALVFLTAVGCGTPQERIILEQGTSLVEQSLRAWQDKKKPEDLKGGTPSISFFDDDWNRQATLLDYEILELFVEPTDGKARVGVLLKIRQANGRESQVRCAYQVVVEPEIVIARDPMS
jgi:hypothetical protein